MFVSVWWVGVTSQSMRPGVRVSSQQSKVNSGWGLGPSADSSSSKKREYGKRMLDRKKET